MKCLKFRKFFSNKVVVIPPKLKAKNPKKVNTNKNKSPVYNLLQTEKLVESTGEVKNFDQKTNFETKILSGAKEMLINNSKLFADDKKTIEELKNFIIYSLNAKEQTLLKKYLEQTVELISSKDVEISENLFSVLLDKIYNLTTNDGNFF